MKRLRHIQKVMNEFQAQHPDIVVSGLETVWSHSWPQEVYDKRVVETGWKEAAGVYLFIDFCRESDWAWDDDTLAESERFSIIRRIGKAVHIGRRYENYDSRWADNGRVCWTFDKKGGEYWFRYTQIDVLRTSRLHAGTLETFLLENIGTTHNDKGRRPPEIYDEHS